MRAVRRRVAGAWQARAERRAEARRSRPGLPENFAPLVAILFTHVVIAAAAAAGLAWLLQHHG